MPLMGRLRCLLSSGTMRYSVLKDHYPDTVVWGSIIQSLKGPAADIARYMGPTTSVDLYPATTFRYFWHGGLFQCSWCRTSTRSPKVNNEKAPFFVMWLEGNPTLSSNSNALGGWQTLRCNRTSRIAFSMGSASTFCELCPVFE